jgi:hypothetical protein
MSEGRSCSHSIVVGDGIVGEDRKPRWVRSIAELVDENGTVVGWVFLADDYHTDRAEYVAANHAMSPSDIRALRLRASAAPISSVSLLVKKLPPNLHVKRCAGF